MHTHVQVCVCEAGGQAGEPAGQAGALRNTIAGHTVDLLCKGRLYDISSKSTSVE